MSVRAVDNRVFLLGLDQLYRRSMKIQERTELLGCARAVAKKLSVPPARGPVEGYYHEDETLTEYFQLMRALQDVPNKRTDEVERTLEFQRLYAITSSPVFGRPQNEDKLLPAGRDALSRALLVERKRGWSMATLVPAAHQAAEETDDYSLVGLAAYVEDPVVLTALRESVVLYAEVITLGALEPPTAVWEVDEVLARRAQRFIDEFNDVVRPRHLLPAANDEYAETFLHAASVESIAGRCVRIGIDVAGPVVRHYHWAIRQKRWDEFEAVEFWDTELWTTQRYLEERVWLRRRSISRFGNDLPVP